MVKMPEKGDFIRHTENLVKYILLLVLLIDTLKMFFSFSLHKSSKIIFICVYQNNDNNARNSTNITGRKVPL